MSFDGLTTIQSNRGILHLNEIGLNNKPGDCSSPIEDVSVLNLNYKLTKILQHYNLGKVCGSKIRFDNNYILKCSNDTKLICEDEPIEVDKLKHGDYVNTLRINYIYKYSNIVPRTIFNNYNKLLPDKMSDELSFIIGNLCNPSFTKNIKDDNDNVYISFVKDGGINCSNTLFSHYISSVFNKFDNPIYYDGAGYYIDKVIWDFLNSLFIKDNEEYVPTQILRGTKTNQINFLNGILEHNEWNMRSSVRLCNTTNDKFSNDIYGIACAFGLKNSIKRKNIKSKEQRSEVYSIINKNSFLNYETLYPPTFKLQGSLMVESVIPCTINAYDISIEGDYVLNQIVIANNP